MMLQVQRLVASSDGRRLLAVHLARVVAKPVDRAWAQILRLVDSDGTAMAPVAPWLILGPPRSGTTLIYQYLACALNVTYIHNRWSLWPRSAPYRMDCVDAVPQGNYDSFYGNGTGPFGVHEGGSVFDLWMPRGETDALDSITDAVVADMRRYVAAIERLVVRPILIKNGRNAVRIPVLLRAWPNLRVIRIRRDLVSVALSILAGREALTGSLEANWTVLPREWPLLKGLAAPEQVAAQAFFIDRAIDAGLRACPGVPVLDVEYDSFCARPMELVDRILRTDSRVQIRKVTDTQALPQSFRPSRGTEINETSDRIRHALATLGAAENPLSTLGYLAGLNRSYAEQP